MIVETESPVGYAHPAYATALAEFGRPRELVQSGSWILERAVPGADALDAMGCYPIFACRDWSVLKNDLENLGQDLVSLVLVADPFGNFTEDILHKTFEDLIVPFKEHFVVDLSRPIKDLVEPHHQRNARRALGMIEVECAASAESWLDEWNGLYTNLVDRHSITGIAAFSRDSLGQQLRVPGITAFRATQNGQTIGMNLWYIHQAVGYYHLGAYSEEGYRLRASFALFWRAIEHFSAVGLRWLNLGAGAGTARDGTDGLTRFKRGWTDSTRMAYLCGRVFDHTKYRRLTEAKGMNESHYFPAYRKGEFV